MGVVAAIGPDLFEPVEALADFVEDKGRAVTILDAGGMDHHAHWQSQGVDQGVDLAPLHLLASVITHCVVFALVFTAPFSAAFSDWLSMMAALGLASRPDCSRKATSNASHLSSV